MPESTDESLYEELLPPDGELFRRRKNWSNLMERYNEDPAEGIDIEDLPTNTTTSEMENKNDIDDNESIPIDEYEDKNLESDKYNVRNVLNNTLKVIEKRKNNWYETGVDEWLDIFCTNSPLDKVDDWLRKNEKYFLKGMYKHKYDKKSLNEIRITDHHFVMDKTFDSTSLDSVDTAKYILSNQRKTQKTRMRTMTIKSYRFFKEQQLKIIECGSRVPDHHTSSAWKLNNNNNEKKKFRKRLYQYLKSPSLRSSSSSLSSSSSSFNLLDNRKKYVKPIDKYAQYKNQMRKRKSSMSPVLECLEATKIPKISYEMMNKSNIRNKNETNRSRRLQLFDSPKSVNYKKSFDNREISNQGKMKRSIIKSSKISRDISNEKNNSKRLHSSSKSCSSVDHLEKDENIKRNKRLFSNESSNSTAIPEKEKIVERNKRLYSRESSNGNINSATSIIDLTNDKSEERSSSGSSSILIYTPKSGDSTQKNNIVNGKFLLTSNILEETIGSELTRTDSNKIIDGSNLNSDLINSQFCPENVINSTALSGKNKKIERNKRLHSSSKSCSSTCHHEKDNNIKCTKRLFSSESSNSTAIPEKEKIVERNERLYSRESSNGNINSATSIIDLNSDKLKERSSSGSSPIIIYTPKAADSTQKNNIVNGKFLLTSKILEEILGSELTKTFLERNKNFSHSFDSESEILFYPPDKPAESSDSEADILETMSSRKYGQILEVVKA